MACSTFFNSHPVDLQGKVSEGENSYNSPEESLIAHQFIISTQKYWGIGVVLSPNRIATAAHVVSDVTVGETVTVKYAMGVRERFAQARLKVVDPANEIAILDLVDSQFPPQVTPKFCSHGYGGDKLVSRSAKR